MGAVSPPAASVTGGTFASVGTLSVGMLSVGTIGCPVVGSIPSWLGSIVLGSMPWVPAPAPELGTSVRLSSVGTLSGIGGTWPSGRTAIVYAARSVSNTMLLKFSV